LYGSTRYDVRMHQHTRGGARLKAWIRNNGKTQEWVAERIGTHQTNVSAWILGRPVPLEAAIAIRRITKIPVEDWIVPAQTRKARSVPESSTDMTSEQAEAS